MRDWMAVVLFELNCSIRTDVCRCELFPRLTVFAKLKPVATPIEYRNAHPVGGVKGHGISTVVAYTLVVLFHAQVKLGSD